MFLAVKMGGRVRTGISRTQMSSRDAQVFLALKMGGKSWGRDIQDSDE